MNDEKTSINTQLENDTDTIEIIKEEVSDPRDNTFADPKTDADPRTSNVGMTSIGASDLNADTATQDKQSPDAVPGVRN